MQAEKLNLPDTRFLSPWYKSVLLDLEADGITDTSQISFNRLQLCCADLAKADPDLLQDALIEASLDAKIVDGWLTGLERGPFTALVIQKLAKVIDKDLAENVICNP
jgi:hypothetical protein